MTQTEYKQKRSELLDKAKRCIISGDAEAAEKMNAAVETLDAEYATQKANAQALMPQHLKSIENYSRDISGGKEIENMNENTQTVRDIVASESYHTSWLRNLKGEMCTPDELKAITSADGAVPTRTANEILRKVELEAPLLQEINLLHMPADMKIAREDVSSDAALHVENASVTEASDALAWITLGGYEIIKLVRISAKTAKMSIPAFEDWLTTEIAEHIANKANYYVAKGTGTNQPQGMLYARTWTENTSLITWAGDYPTYKELCKLCALVKGKDAGKKWYMSTATWWGSIMPHRNDSQYKDAIKEDAGGGFRLNNYPVVFDDTFDDDEIYFGNLKRAIVGNMGDDIEIKSSSESGFRTNSVDYRGTCIFDCTVAFPTFLVRSTKAAASADPET